MNEELFIQELEKANNRYFEKHFQDKDINVAIGETMMEGLKILLKAYTKFVFLENSINIIKGNKKFWQKLDNDTKSTTKIILKGIKKINKVIANVLLPISEGMSLNKNP